MADGPNKQAIITQLAQARHDLTVCTRQVARAVNVPARFQSSVRDNKLSWLAGAGFTGWILAKLPSRKKKVKVFVNRDAAGVERKLGETAKVGLLLTLGRMLFTLLRPLVTKLLTEKLGAVAKDYVSQRMDRDPGFSARPVRAQPTARR